MLSSKCAIYSSKNSIFIKEEEAIRLISSLGIKTSLSKILLLGSVLFSLF